MVDQCHLASREEKDESIKRALKVVAAVIQDTRFQQLRLTPTVKALEQAHRKIDAD
jgi:hypothetical protein